MYQIFFFDGPLVYVRNIYPVMSVSTTTTTTNLTSAKFNVHCYNQEYYQ
jgi:hypothetical protein